MNREAVQNEINSIIEANHKTLGKFSSKQYPVGKAQITTLTELGIIELMPLAPYSRTIGHSDAKAVIEAAQDSGKGASTDALSDDPATYPASKLYTLLNEVDEPIGGGNADIHVGDYVQVAPHTTYGDLRRGAVHSIMHTHLHNGYHRVRVHCLLDDGFGGTIVEVEVGDLIDEIPLQFCRKA